MGRSRTGTSSISFSARFITSNGRIRCSIACRTGAEQFAGREIDAIYADYFRRVREMAATGLVDCLAHIDLVKIHGHRPTRDSRERWSTKRWI